MRRLSNVARSEGRRWKRLFFIMIGRGVEPINTGNAADSADTKQEDTAALVADIAKMTARREEEAQRALSNIRHLYHEADQPYTVAKAKTSMLKRVAHGN